MARGFGWGGGVREMLSTVMLYPKVCVFFVSIPLGVCTLALSHSSFKE
jgi:hypothetical protein